MDPAIAATLIGVLVAALLGVFAGALHVLRSDIRRVEGKLDSLLLALACSGHLTMPHAAPSLRQWAKRPDELLGGT